jgi:hypothetical protein
MGAVAGRTLDGGDGIGDVGLILARPVANGLHNCNSEGHGAILV